MSTPSEPGPGRHPAWVIVVPVRMVGKTRLADALGPGTVAVARAMALDTLQACREAVGPAQVVVVTPDPSWLAGLPWQPQVVIDDGVGLDAAIRQGWIEAAARWPQARRAALLGDHPALRASEVCAALTTAAGHDRALVRDASGAGSALLTVAPGLPVEVAFGPGSAARHEALGYRDLGLDLPGLRTDVDDPASLHAASVIGLGPHTRQALGEVALASMQASVHTFADGGGSVLLDDGREIPFDEAAWAGSGLRHLRVGQRVSVLLDAEQDSLTRLWIVGIGAGEIIR